MGFKWMTDRRSFVIGAGAMAAAPHLAWARGVLETPSLQELVKAGGLPPLSERLPLEPLVVDLPAKGREPGRHGGRIRTLIGKKKAIRYAVVWGYARLVGYDEQFNLQPDLLKSVEVEDGSIFTLKLRKGHKWSDGAPFTSDDFRYWWDDVANNPDLSPAGPPAFLLIDGELPTVTFPDETTVRYAWSAPNPLFLSELARARPPFIYRPAHYLKPFHNSYGDTDTIAKLVEEKQMRSWAQLHNSLDNMYKNDNPALPTLQPWRNVTDGKALRYIMERNPFYHRVDTAGHQLPYIDAIEMTVSDSGLAAAKANAGEVDLQARGLSFSDAAILKAGEEKGDYRLLLWPEGVAAHIALYPNLNTKDPVWRGLMRDSRFRQALSLGVDRKLINETLYFGMAKPYGNAAIAASPLHDPDHAAAYAGYDPATANKLLDEAGLDKHNDAGIRLLPDGRPLELVIETAGERKEEVDALQLITETWRELGIKLLVRPTDRDILRNRTYAGETVMTVWSGWDNGVPTPDATPAELAPTQQDMLCWPGWGQHHQTKGEKGSAPDMGAAQRLLTLYNDWMHASSTEQRKEIWKEMLSIHAEEQFVIGVVCEAPQPVVASKRLMNVPERALYGWDPGAHFGVHRIDEWWFNDA